MPTQLASYCQQFDGTLRPVLQALQDATTALDGSAADEPARQLLTGIGAIRTELTALCDKVKEQQAFVLIFGPLKSGKSTLMNAIAGAYVSEVSSLPAYPCLVFVRHGEKREYVCTQYDGTTERFTAPQAIHEHIEEAHKDLAQAIRRAEQRGQAFDPEDHFPGAIRRVDVHVPGTHLASDSTVLVDTPGLYTRMRFGYDRMTRDFRNAAACAIFVVKSDTLFLEQVFTEFEQLLALFSRIFLVVNVDSQKRDVGPDGRLVPALEQSEPQAILQAFEQLAMSAPLKQAASEGRVKIYPVDLLHAASSVLQKRSTNDQPDSYREFRKDLSDYLASPEYVAAFLNDSLQRGRTLLEELGRTVDGDELAQLQQRIAQIDEELEFYEHEQRRIRLALELDWSEAFRHSLEEIESEVERAARDQGAKLLRTLGASIDTWFLSSHSLSWLTDGQWTPLVRDFREDVRQAGLRAFERQQQQSGYGLNLPDGIEGLLDRAGVQIRQTRIEALQSLGAVAWKGDTAVPVDIDHFPVKKGMFDVVRFKSVNRIRQDLFGTAGGPESGKNADRKIPGKEKASRLGEPGRLHLHKCVAQFRTDLTPRTVAVLVGYFGRKFEGAVIERLHSGLEEYRPRIDAATKRLQDERSALIELATPLGTLSKHATELDQRLTALGTQFAREEPTVVLQRPESNPAAGTAGARRGAPRDSGRRARKG